MLLFALCVQTLRFVVQGHRPRCEIYGLQHSHYAPNSSPPCFTLAAILALHRLAGHFGVTHRDAGDDRQERDRRCRHRRSSRKTRRSTSRITATPTSRRSAMTPDTLFWIAPMTKPITGVAIMLLQDEGKLNVTDPVAKIHPGVCRPENTVRQDREPHHHANYPHQLGEYRPAAQVATTLTELVPVLPRPKMQYEPGREMEIHAIRHQRCRPHRRSRERRDVRRISPASLSFSTRSG